LQGIGFGVKFEEPSKPTSYSMTESEVILHKKLVKDQLTLISLYWEDFEKRIGKKALDELINSLLDKKMKLEKDFPNIKT
jgi:hypothetical protein